MTAKPHEDPNCNCKCKACEGWYQEAKQAENTAAAGRDFEQRMFAAWRESAQQNRPCDAVLVNPRYARACGIPEHTTFGGVEVLFDINVAGHDIHPVQKAGLLRQTGLTVFEGMLIL